MNNNIKENIQTSVGIGAGIGTYHASRRLIHKMNKKIFSSLETPLTKEQIDTFNKAGNEIYQKYFKEQGLKIFDISKEDYNKLFNEKYENINSYYDKKIEQTKNPIRKFFLKYQKKKSLKATKALDKETIRGKNAYYREVSRMVNENGIKKLKKDKKIIINMEKTPIYLFHELGHAKNFGKNAYYREVSRMVNENGIKKLKKDKKIIINMEKTPIYLFHELGHAKNFMDTRLSIAMKSLWKNSIFQRNATIFLLTTSLLTKPETNNDVTANKEHKNPLYPLGLFIKNNCGKLMTMILLPSVLEEGLASLNGQKMGKEVLKGKDLNVLTKSHLKSFAGYSAWAAGAGIAVYLANKVRDKIAEYKPVH